MPFVLTYFCSMFSCLFRSWKYCLILRVFQCFGRPRNDLLFALESSEQASALICYSWSCTFWLFSHFFAISSLSFAVFVFIAMLQLFMYLLKISSCNDVIFTPYTEYVFIVLILSLWWYKFTPPLWHYKYPKHGIFQNSILLNKQNHNPNAPNFPAKYAQCRTLRYSMK